MAIEALKEFLPYTDSVAAILMFGLLALWGQFKNKDSMLIGELKAQIEAIRKEMDTVKLEVSQCEHEREQVRIENAGLKAEIKILRNELDVLKSQMKEHVYNG